MSSNRLSDLVPGQKAVIKTVLYSKFSAKLAEMGCLPGEAIELCHIAPLGDPIAIQVAGYKLSLRLSEAESILVY